MGVSDHLIRVLPPIDNPESDLEAQLLVSATVHGWLPREPDLSPLESSFQFQVGYNFVFIIYYRLLSITSLFGNIALVYYIGKINLYSIYLMYL